ncbi:uncharacterized protein LOC108111851 [Drosophila eugracilis]|uniref:uncharacterized protein LOC108111851 n=1 Tax=Drosophila eugracilis TaxID=29029 RepID=UPI0007E60689|nr:uncharacterized protein LOC108111851 [Drosophila eugracilis]
MTQETDDQPFNPFYIGPHPSKACAIPEIPGRQCSPNCQPPEGQATTKPSPYCPSSSDGQEPMPSGAAGGMVIMGVANIYSTVEVLAAAARLADPNAAAAAAGTGGAAQATPAPNNTICKPYPCMEGARNDSPGCG